MSRSTSCRRARPSTSRCSRTSSRSRANSTWRRTKTAKAKPSAGTCSSCSSRKCRCTGWSSTKSPKTPFRMRWSRPVDVDDGLVRAQETRRILDRLYGYEVSPLLWRKVRPKLSAGRVQSVAVRLIVERERERMAFVSGHLVGPAGPVCQRQDGRRSRRRWSPSTGSEIPSGKDFDPATGKIKNPDLLLLDRQAGRRTGRADSWRRVPRHQGRGQALHDAARTRRSPPARCSRRRTASSVSPPGARCRWRKACTKTATSPTCVPTRTNLASVAVEDARELVVSEYGQEYLPDAPRTYAGKVKNAQEAHEAIRPAGHPFELPGAIKSQAERRRVQDLRLDLEADHRQPDGRRPRPADLDHHRGRRLRVPGERQDDRLSRLFAGVRRRLRRSRRPNWPTRKRFCPRW